MRVIDYEEARRKFKDEDLVSIESMGFSWKLPWKTVKEDVKTGWATLYE